MRIKLLVGICLFVFAMAALASTEISSAEPTEYAVVMANGSAIRVAEYAIDLELETITYKSVSSGLTATFPLERIIRVVSSDPLASVIPANAPVMFANAVSLAQPVDDGGIPVVFKVTRQVVGSGGSRPSTARPGSQSFSSRGKGSSSSGSRSTGSRSSKSFGSSSSKTRTGASSSRSPSSSSNRSSGSEADSFFNALFGGK